MKGRPRSREVGEIEVFLIFGQITGCLAGRPSGARPFGASVGAREPR